MCEMFSLPANAANLGDRLQVACNRKCRVWITFHQKKLSFWLSFLMAELNREYGLLLQDFPGRLRR